MLGMPRTLRTVTGQTPNRNQPRLPSLPTPVATTATLVRPLTSPMAPHPISIRPTKPLRHWLDEQRQQRGLSLNALVILALEKEMARAAQTHDPEQL